MRPIRIALVLLALGLFAMAEDSASKELPHHQAPSSAKAAALPFHYYATENGGTFDDPQKDVCLSLHTLVVARNDNRADTTHLVSQRNCTPAAQFQTKAAVVNPSK